MRLFLRVFFMVFAAMVEGIDQTNGGDLACSSGYAGAIARLPRKIWSRPESDVRPLGMK